MQILKEKQNLMITKMQQYYLWAVIMITLF